MCQCAELGLPVSAQGATVSRVLGSTCIGQTAIVLGKKDSILSSLLQVYLQPNKDKLNGEFSLPWLLYFIDSSLGQLHSTANCEQP